MPPIQCARCGAANDSDRTECLFCKAPLNATNTRATTEPPESNVKPGAYPSRAPTIVTSPAGGTGARKWEESLPPVDELARHYLEPDDSPVTDPPLHHSRLSRVGRPTSAGPTRAERGVAAILLAIGAALALFVLISLTRPGATQAQGPASPETTIPEQTEGQKQGHAYLEGTSNTANATLYFQDPSGSTESIDCSPDSALVTLSPGRYLVWIQDSGGKIIAQKRLVQADPGQTIYVGPDRSP